MTYKTKGVIELDETTVKDSEKAGLIKNIYYQSNGTGNWYKHWTGAGTYTDGVKAIADAVGGYWLIDAIYSYNRKEEFQLWVLDVSDGKAVLTMREDSDLKPLVTQNISFTDFPTGKWEFYLENHVLCLPMER